MLSLKFQFLTDQLTMSPKASKVLLWFIPDRWIVLIRNVIVAVYLLEIKIIYLIMAEEEGAGCTTNDFLTKLKFSHPKKRLINKLSLNTDLEEINRFLQSPVAAIQKKSFPTVLNIEKTKLFVVELLRKYEKSEEIQKKWEKFIESVNSPQQFNQFIHSLKSIAFNQKHENDVANPQNTAEVTKFKENPQKRKAQKRAFSSKKIQSKRSQGKAKASNKSELRQILKKQIIQLKDALLYGEKFIHSA